MIRHTTDSEWILIPQDAHAQSCGVMARHLLGDRVGLPSNRGKMGIALHDSGWPLHDDRPTLDETGKPAHVFHTPVAIVTRLWAASVTRASQRDPYAGLLTSIHGLHLVAFALQSPRDRQAVFELNKFQHQQVEFQEQIRRQIGMRTDRPMQHGLGRPGIDPLEDELIRDYRTLRALDQISLAALCSETLFDSVLFQSLAAIADPTPVEIQHEKAFALKLSPWPFSLPRMDIRIDAKRIPQQAFSDEAAFRDVYTSTPTRQIEFHLEPIRITSGPATGRQKPES